MSWLRFLTLKSCKQQNPDWDITLYTHASTVCKQTWKDAIAQDFFSYDEIDYTDQLADLGINIVEWDLPVGIFPAGVWKNMAPSHKSNVFKWHMLATVGGIYADLDILWTKPLDDFHKDIEDYDTVICFNKWLLIGLLASQGNNPFFRKVLNTAVINYSAMRYQCVGVESVYVWLYSRRVYDMKGAEIIGINWNKVLARPIWEDLQRAIPHMKFYNIPMNLIYPFDHNNLDKIFIETVGLPVETIGIHWYAGNPLSQSYNNLMNHLNYLQIDNTFCGHIG